MAIPESPIGLISNLSNEDYHAGPGVSCSGLHLIAKSPEIYYGRVLDPRRPPREDKAGQFEGTLAHCAILEPLDFFARYAVGPDVSKATKAWKEFAELHADKVCIKPGQYETAMRQAESVRKLKQVSELLLSGVAEQSAYWVDEETQELCRVRPDWSHKTGGGSILLDVKTCGDASPHEFARQIARKSYEMQDSFYSDGYAIASGMPVHGFIFVAVESEWPYAASAVMLDEDSKEVGRESYKRLLRIYSDCRKSGVWPGYSSEIEQVSLPSWKFDNDEEIEVGYV